MPILPAHHSDANAIARLVNLAYEVERFFVLGDRTSPEKVRAAMESGPILIARNDDGDLVACAQVETHGKKGSFGMLAVDPKEQHKGWGGRLVEAAENYARKAGCDTLEIRVVNLRDDLLPWYRKLGYLEAGTELYDHRPTIRDCHFVVMRKRLFTYY